MGVSLLLKALSAVHPPINPCVPSDKSVLFCRRLDGVAHPIRITTTCMHMIDCSDRLILSQYFKTPSVATPRNLARRMFHASQERYLARQPQTVHPQTQHPQRKYILSSVLRRVRKRIRTNELESLPILPHRVWHHSSAQS